VHDAYLSSALDSSRLLEPEPLEDLEKPLCIRAPNPKLQVFKEGVGVLASGVAPEAVTAHPVPGELFAELPNQRNAGRVLMHEACASLLPILTPRSEGYSTRRVSKRGGFYLQTFEGPVVEFFLG
jgi:hypothetical protein